MTSDQHTRDPRVETERDPDHISTVRRHLIDQMRALRTAPAGEGLGEEIRRAKALAEVAQTIVDSAKVEVEMVKAIGGNGETPFLDPRPALPAPPEGEGEGQQGASPFPTSATRWSGGTGRRHTCQ